ncbi:hypothetical protein H4219_005257 [Mycoemilia scoparia]|uniref:Uncharacterized protein n=1 Tax=Mycoemilia scoparia TaxID=417184 RepID=A0A9W8DPN0_9FUNG|nr:hypothetical protein H4219_005257 [Mycoemilia scoparia]
MNQPEERTNASRELPFQRLRDFRENGGTIGNTPYTEMIEYNNQRNFNMEFINHRYKYLSNSTLVEQKRETEDGGIVIYPDEDEYDMNDLKILRIMYSFKVKYQDNIQDDNDSEASD